MPASITAEDITSLLKTKIAELKLNPDFVSHLEDHQPLADVGIDSANTIYLVVQIEQHFNITFEDEELLLENFSTLHIITSKIQEKLGLLR